MLVDNYLRRLYRTSLRRRADIGSRQTKKPDFDPKQGLEVEADFGTLERLDLTKEYTCEM
jgi:hypothetical protein